MKEKILIVEDQFIEANNLQMILEKAGYQICGIARSVEIALEIMEQVIPDIVLLDIFLKGTLTGIDLAYILRDRQIAFVYLSANFNKEILDAAKATHPYGFLVKPFREKDILVTLNIARYRHEHSLESRLTREPDLQNQLDSFKPTLPLQGAGIPKKVDKLLPGLPGIIGQSPALQQVLSHLQIVSPTETTVLILGENGTGKERLADLIHHLSPRKNKPFIKVNCAALPTALIESELFGHEKGSFTGATERRIGKFEQAEGGTIFLDEIGEMSLDLQVKLLRVLQEKEIDRIGGKSTVRVNIRIVAATNKDLEKEVSEGRFRIDLFYRLHVFPLISPPLRDRKEDIPLLTKYFISLYSSKVAKSITGVSEELLAEMMSYSWPGNVRELEHFVERSVLLSQGNTLQWIPLPKFAPKQSSAPATGNQNLKTMEENERDYILLVLEKCGGKVSGPGGAAECLNLPVSTLNSRMKKLGIGLEKRFN